MTPTPTAQDWERLGMKLCAAEGEWMAGTIRDLEGCPDFPDVPCYVVLSELTARYEDGEDNESGLVMVSLYALGEAAGTDYAQTFDWPWLPEHEAFTICAALVLLASGVLTTGAQE